ncbi:uncharacterized protein L3040_009205 [Drepanopeziza brunnea f. sp. 'multigermtubi']|uniref:Transcription factor c2h2 protein n=1 Tax=Marssonina brunnea f. sp. multigermtubi (strain MB_m1) TaxID=1072389 RepID=K1WNU9_MARBU|nr:uncharacterized protein MBM_02592 [Drepanopeziza brunnea f. sp. 'multigermtubi' MB_m1]EKD19355.1 hypothetical protein MBM_02592 [Drepanopeziza brunnea f. sp. 'multigermtubi' MB_m1]KAJ5032608.1 hypothetical protein L3040_009205 [Drepanopeziza brunnea f. sp. 'multigermtubi']
MDALCMHLGVQNSSRRRSRSSSHLSSTAAQLQGLNITSLSSPSDERSRSTSGIQSNPESRASPNPDFFNQGSAYSSPKDILTAPVPQQYTSFPLLSDSDLDGNWSYLSASEEPPRSAPLHGLDTAQAFSNKHQHIGDHSSVCSESNSSNMSTLGIQQFDSRFDASMNSDLRHTYSWPPFDMNDQQFISQSQNLIHGQFSHLYDEPKLMSSYSRSLSSSPPRSSFTPEQRKLKRQRDLDRRDSKSRARRDRSMSNTSNRNPYIVSQNGSPDLLPGTLPDYTSNPSQSPLLSQGSLHGSPALGSNDFLGPFIPPLSIHGQSDMYCPVYAMGPNDFPSAPAYPIPFSNAGGEPDMQAFASRPHSMSLPLSPDMVSMYGTQQASPKVGSSEPGDHVRVVHSRPKPQCWEHGCNGRQFSTFSNLLRHQREKSGAAQKSSCPNCGAEFTRTTARNGHMAHDKCKSRRES